MDKVSKVQEIAKSLLTILPQLDELQMHIAAIKVEEAISALSKTAAESEYDQIF